MARRKRLLVPAETKSPETVTVSTPLARMPIATVAGEIAGQAALAEVAGAMEAAESEGRLIRHIAIDRIDRQVVNRDRTHYDADEMAALEASIAERGQQMPIEVMRRGGRFALISGTRRLLALDRLGETEVLALVRDPKDAVAAHVAMVEENEIRADLSFWERANLAVTTVNSGVFPDPRRAIDTLFARAPSSKRSKIARFVVVRKALGGTLRFPAAIPEKLGLALATAIETDPKVATRIADALRKTPPADAGAERRVLERALKAPTPDRPAPVEIAPGITLEGARGRVTLKGRGVDAAFLDALRDWAVSHAKRKAPSD